MISVAGANSLLQQYCSTFAMGDTVSGLNTGKDIGYNILPIFLEVRQGHSSMPVLRWIPVKTAVCLRAYFMERGNISQQSFRIIMIFQINCCVLFQFCALNFEPKDNTFF
jgi:hypothetical protein